MNVKYKRIDLLFPDKKFTYNKILLKVDNKTYHKPFPAEINIFKKYTDQFKTNLLNKEEINVPILFKIPFTPRFDNKN
jgi:hypothetical protein